MHIPIVTKGMGHWLCAYVLFWTILRVKPIVPFSYDDCTTDSFRSPYTMATVSKQLSGVINNDPRHGCK